MVTNKECVDWILKNRVCESGVIDLSGLDFSAAATDVRADEWIVDGNLGRRGARVSGSLDQGFNKVSGSLNDDQNFAEGNASFSKNKIILSLSQTKNKVYGYTFSDFDDHDTVLEFNGSLWKEPNENCIEQNEIEKLVANVMGKHNKHPITE